MTNNHYAAIKMQLDEIEKKMNRTEQQVKLLMIALTGDLEKDKPGLLESVRINGMKIKVLFGIVSLTAFTVLSLIGSILYIVFSDGWARMVEGLTSGL